MIIDDSVVYLTTLHLTFFSLSFKKNIILTMDMWTFLKRCYFWRSCYCPPARWVGTFIQAWVCSLQNEPDRVKQDKHFVKNDSFCIGSLCWADPAFHSVISSSFTSKIVRPQIHLNCISLRSFPVFTFSLCSVSL